MFGRHALRDVKLYAFRSDHCKFHHSLKLKKFGLKNSRNLKPRLKAADDTKNRLGMRAVPNVPAQRDHLDCWGISSATPYKRAKLSKFSGSPFTRKSCLAIWAALVQPSNKLTAAESTESTWEKST